MFKVVLTVFATLCMSFGCAHEQKNQKNPDLRHQTCKISEDFVATLADASVPGQQGIGARVAGCGSLQSPHDNLGYSVLDVVIVRFEQKKLSHSLVLLKFAEVEGRWQQIAPPEVIAEFTQDLKQD